MEISSRAAGSYPWCEVTVRSVDCTLTEDVSFGEALSLIEDLNAVVSDLNDFVKCEFERMAQSLDEAGRK